EVDAGAEHAEDAPALADDAVHPDLGNAQIGVVVDVEVAAFAQRQRRIIPGIIMFGGVERVAILVAGIGVGRVVEIVIPRCADDEEIGSVGKIAPIMLELAYAAA